MDDKSLMEKELLVIKGVCDVHTTFKEALNESLDIQNKIYNLMAEKGWYKTENVEQSKIDSTKQKFQG